MDISFTDQELAFRDEVRTFFAEEIPSALRAKLERGIEIGKQDQVDYQKLLFRQGYFAPNWPKEYGGPGWTTIQKYIYASEMAAAEAPQIIPFGVNMVGPVIYSFGSEEQKKRFLPDILESNVWWCQGYSEPGSGSDLASLKTRADLEGDHYLINGTKTWTTLGQYADWIFVLARTNTEVARRQEGISFILIDMSTAGISVKPIITLDGAHEVNEVHFENVRVPLENLVGDEGKGWTYGKVLLQHERTNLTGVAHSKVRLARLRKQAGEAIRGAEPLRSDRNFMRRLGAIDVELKALEITDLRTLAAVASGKAPGPESSILKIKGTEVAQMIDALEMEAAGYYALPYVPAQYQVNFDDAARIGYKNETLTSLRYFNNRKASIYGGSNEIQKNIVAKHVLGL
ncbi:MAG TPA: acyl-CoA dehydrogenase family protein [Woeseiaceae bacterium]|nr:acyl-CoA dehydrogenase family protein [Woeseiaceae bacterium]